MNPDDLLSSYQFDLPRERIAQRPAERRDASRLMVLHPGGGVEDAVFSDLPRFLSPGDILVRNNARVMPARLLGKRPGGGATELLLVRPDGFEGGESWLCLARPASHLKTGGMVAFGEGELVARIASKEAGGAVRVVFSDSGWSFREKLERLGRLPLPPYIDRPRRQPTAEDVERYQTTYAAKDGAVAAPTAGLHFTPEVDRALREHGIEIAELTLYVGPGTFRPVKTESLGDHRMDPERYEIPEASWEKIKTARKRGGRIVAVGTTSARVLESMPDGEEAPRLAGWTSLFIRPGHEFAFVDGVVTNFHLPGSSLVILASALAGRERLLAAYAEAVRKRYRFYSYGDAMLVWRDAAGR